MLLFIFFSQKITQGDNNVKKIATPLIEQQNIHEQNENGTIQIKYDNV